MSNQTIKLDISTPKYPDTYTIIDADMYKELSKYHWYVNNKGYVMCSLYKSYKKRKGVSLHRFIMNPKKDEQIDHIDRNRLNNTRKNLRVVTNQQNRFNSKIPDTNKSGYKGVHWIESIKKWRARIHLNGKSFSLGCYSSPKLASDVYNTVAKEIHGNFFYKKTTEKKLNFDDKTQNKINQVICKIQNC